jgi:uncharacterized protein (DUF1499 family)
MKIALFIAAGGMVALAIGYVLHGNPPGYKVYYGIGRLTGAPLDIGPVRFDRLRRRATPNDALLCPLATCPNAKSDFAPKTYDMPPSALLTQLTVVAMSEPNTGALYCLPCETRARFVQYSRIMRFPDTIDVEVFPVGAEQSTLAIYSRSLVGYSDLGVNRARIARWLAALERSP